MSIKVGPIQSDGKQTIKISDVFENGRIATWKKEDVDTFMKKREQEDFKVLKKSAIFGSTTAVLGAVMGILGKLTKSNSALAGCIAGGLVAGMNFVYGMYENSKQATKEFEEISKKNNSTILPECILK